ncbi:MAG: prefoldin subunit, partial [Nanoarchaeota archaeon]|nr:prefoldin subunit [Nanoarchaeota archaeon]
MSVQQLQLVQQNLQNILLQKQQVQNQLIEYNSALENLKGTDKAYQITGKIMIAQSAEKITKDLQEKKETAEVRLKNFE